MVSLPCPYLLLVNQRELSCDELPEFLSFSIQKTDRIFTELGRWISYEPPQTWITFCHNL